jgi:hypothetical protein
VEVLAALADRVMRKLISLQEALAPRWKARQVLLDTPQHTQSTRLEFVQLFQRERQEELRLTHLPALGATDAERLQVLYDVCPEALLTSWAASVIEERFESPAVAPSDGSGWLLCGWQGSQGDLHPEDLVNSLRRERQMLDEQVQLPSALSFLLAIDAFLVKVVPGPIEDVIKLELFGGKVDAKIAHGVDHKGLVAPTADVKVDMRGLGLTQGARSVLRFRGDGGSSGSSSGAPAFGLRLKNELGKEQTVISLYVHGEPMEIELVPTLVPSLMRFPQAPAVIDMTASLAQLHMLQDLNFKQPRVSESSVYAENTAADGQDTVLSDLAGSPNFVRSSRSSPSSRTQESHMNLTPEAHANLRNSKTAEVLTESLRKSEEWLESDNAKKAFDSAVQRLPDAVRLDFKLNGPIIRVPSMLGSYVELSLGLFELHTPEACTIEDARVETQLSNLGLVVVDDKKLKHEVIAPVSLKTTARGCPGSVRIQTQMGGLQLNLSVRAARTLAAVQRTVLAALCLDSASLKKMEKVLAHLEKGLEELNRDVVDVFEEIVDADESPCRASRAGTLASSTSRAWTAASSARQHENHQRMSTLTGSVLVADKQRLQKMMRDMLMVVMSMDIVEQARAALAKWVDTEVKAEFKLARSTVQLFDFTNPVVRLQCEVPVAKASSTLDFSKVAAAADLQLVLDAFSLRVGRFEPLLEPFHIHGDCSISKEMCAVKLVGQRPLRLNLSPTAVQALAWYVPYFVSMVQEAWEKDPETQKASRYRALNLTAEVLPLSFGPSAKDDPLVESCELRSLDHWILPSNCKRVEVWQEKWLSLAKAGAVGHFVDEGPWAGHLVARLLRPKMEYAVLMVSSTCILVNSTSRPLKVRLSNDKDVSLPCTSCRAWALMNGADGADERSGTGVIEQSEQLCSGEASAVPEQPRPTAASPLLGYSDDAAPSPLLGSKSFNSKLAPLWGDLCAGGSVLPPGEVTSIPVPPDGVSALAYAKTTFSSKSKQFSKSGLGQQSTAKRGLQHMTKRAKNMLSAKSVGSGSSLDIEHAEVEVAPVDGEWMSLSEASMGTLLGLCSGGSHFLVMKEASETGPPASLPMCTIRVLPALTIESGLPCDCQVEYRLHSDLPEDARCVSVDSLGKIRIYDVATPGKIALRIRVKNRLWKDSWTVLYVGDAKADVKGPTHGNTQKAVNRLLGQSDAVEADLTGPAGATLTVSSRRPGYVVVYCATWLVDRTGWEVSVRHGRDELPSYRNIVFGTHRLDGHSLQCNGKVGPKFELPSEWGMARLADGRAACVRSQLLSEGELQGCRTTCFEVVPWLVLRNDSSCDLELQVDGKSVLVQPKKLITPGFAPGQMRIRVCPDGPFSCPVELCRDLAGAVPLLVGSQPWTLEARPERGVMFLCFIQGSRYTIHNALKEPLSVQVRLSEWVALRPGQEIGLAWLDPIGEDADKKVWCKFGLPEEVGEQFPLDPCTARQQFLGTKAKILSRWRGNQTCMEVHYEDLKRASTSWGMNDSLIVETLMLGNTYRNKGVTKMRLEVLVPEVGLSLLGDASAIHELLYLELSLLRICLEEQPNRDMRLLEASVGDLQIDHPVLATGKNKKAATSTSRPVVVGNSGHSKTSVYPFFRLVAEQGRTRSQDLLIKAIRVEIDEVELTAGDSLVAALQEFALATQPPPSLVAMMGGVGGSSVAEVLDRAGAPAIAKGWVDPEMQQAVHVEEMRVSSIAVHVWCSINHQLLRLPKWQSMFLTALTFSNHLGLDGSTLRLKAKEIRGARGSAPDVAQCLGLEYVGDIFHSLGSVLGNSSLLNIPRAPILVGVRVGDAAVRGAVRTVSKATRRTTGLIGKRPSNEGREEKPPDVEEKAGGGPVISAARTQKVTKLARLPRHFAGPLGAVCEYSVLEAILAEADRGPIEVAVPLRFTSKVDPRGRQLLRVLVLSAGGANVVDVERPEYPAHNVGNIFGEAALVACLDQEQQALDESCSEGEVSDEDDASAPAQSEDNAPKRSESSRPSATKAMMNGAMKLVRRKSSASTQEHFTAPVQSAGGVLFCVERSGPKIRIQTKEHEKSSETRPFSVRVPKLTPQGVVTEDTAAAVDAVGDALFDSLRSVQESPELEEDTWGDDWAEAVREAVSRAKLRAVAAGSGATCTGATTPGRDDTPTKRCIVFEGQLLSKIGGYRPLPSTRRRPSHRWMDKSLTNRHPLLDPKADLSGAPEPPVVLPPMWVAESGWRVAVGEHTDADGWMYGRSFKSYASGDGDFEKHGREFRKAARPLVHRVRVRRWERDYRLDFTTSIAQAHREFVDEAWLQHVMVPPKRRWFGCMQAGRASSPSSSQGLVTGSSGVFTRNSSTRASREALDELLSTQEDASPGVSPTACSDRG